MTELVRSGKEGLPIQAINFPSTNPILVTIAVTGAPQSSTPILKTGLYRITTDGAVQMLKDAVPTIPSATVASPDFFGSTTEYMGLTQGDTVSVVGNAGTKVKLGLAD